MYIPLTSIFIWCDFQNLRILLIIINEVLKEQDKSAFSINIVFVLFIC